MGVIRDQFVKSDMMGVLTIVDAFFAWNRYQLQILHRGYCRVAYSPA